jgi:putative MATE family efflux protein
LKKSDMNIGRQFAKYVSQNVLGMVGMSLYILADTFFISKAVGADGITALNIVLPVYNLIFAIGAMIGVGSAIRFAVGRGCNDVNSDKYFFNAIFFALIFGIIFAVAGIFIPNRIVSVLGGDDRIVAVGAPYTRIFMAFAPCFMWNHICNAFVRNDGAPFTAMMATLLSSIFNIIFDYILMFPLGMGMNGAALATAISPVIGILICCTHFKSSKCTIKFKVSVPSFKRLLRACQVGVSSFVGEISSGVITVAFNMIILRIAGNVGVAAYGVVANTALVAVSMCNGVAQGSQPLISEAYGISDAKTVKRLVVMGLGTVLAMTAVIMIFVSAFARQIADIFNSRQIPELTEYATLGLRFYFVGFLFAGINIVGTAALSAVEAAKSAFAASVLRGFVAILIFAFTLPVFLGMSGVWLAFPAAELVTMAVTLTALRLFLV